MPNELALSQLTGCDDSAIDRDSLGVPVHRNVVADFQRLQRDARAAGFDLQIGSGFRNFERQLAIWNAKASGQRPVLDNNERELDISALDDWQRAQAILRWSALPGASRHHWGSDMDVYDAAAVPADYRLRLERSEVEGDGPFVPLHDWLDARISAGDSHGFFRPYGTDRGGVAPERWHLSYAPLAWRCQAQLSAGELWRWLHTRTDIALLATVGEHWDEVYRRFIDVPASAYPPHYREQLIAASH